MTSPQIQANELPIATAEVHRLRLSENWKTVILFTSATTLGGFGWSGYPGLNALALLYPFVYLHSGRRLDSLSALFYYAAATWTVLPASHQFFRGASLVVPPLIWLALIACGSIPWLALYSQRFLPLSALTSVVLLAIPPLGPITLAHPMVAAGAWFPGTRWFGLGLPLLVMGLYRRFGVPRSLAILLGSSLLVHVRFHRPLPQTDIVPINTHLSGSYDTINKLEAETRETAIQKMVLLHPKSLVLLPESVMPGWSMVREGRWAKTFSQLNQQNTGLLIGTTIPIPNTGASRNVLLSRGDTEHFSYVERVPIPLGMWHLGNRQAGFPVMLNYPATIRVWNHRAAVLVCYEQLLVWPALQSLARNPDMLLAPSNLYWAAGTPIPQIQHAAAQNWADLWAIPLYEARNQ